MYARLKSNSAMFGDFKASIRRSIEAEVGFFTLSAENVQLEISGGPEEDTVMVKTTVIPPKVTTASAMQTSLQTNLTSFAQAIAVGIVNVPGIDKVSKFDVEVSHIGSP